jgi:hypothetical protein
MRRLLPLFTLLTLVAACDEADPADIAAASVAAALPAEPCNGRVELCDLRFDQVAYATSHNAMSNRAARWVAPNQEAGITAQLELGVRALMLDTYDFNGQSMLCHGACSLGRQPLVEGLGEVKAFLDAHPREVVSIIFESYLDASKTEAAFDAAGLLPMLYSQPVGQPFETLGALVASNRRLFVVTDSGGGGFDGYQDVWSLSWETDFSNATMEDFSCAPNRGTPGNPLFILNRFLTNPVAYRDLATQANANPAFLAFAEQCWDEGGQIPNFVTVDFVDEGGLMEVVDALNARAIEEAGD